MFETIGYEQIKMHIGKKVEILFTDEKRIVGTLLDFMPENKTTGAQAKINFLPENADESVEVFEDDISFMWLRIDGMVNAVPYLTDEQIEFICKECGITEEELHSFDEDTLYDKVYDVMCDIEIAEVPLDDDEEESERCILASDIVTLLGNALAEAEGYYDEQDELDMDDEQDTHNDTRRCIDNK